MSLLSFCRFCLKWGLSQSFFLLLTTGRVKEASLLFTQTCSFSTLEAQYHTVRYHYRTVRYQYRTVRYHIPYGISPYFFPWHFSLLFPHSFSCSGSLFLASSLSLGFTHGEVHNNSPPGITIRQSSHQAIKPFPSLGGHSTHHQQGVPPLLLQQHPTPLLPPASWHNMCSSTMHSPKAGVSCPQAAGTSHACPASPRGPTSSHTPLLGTSTPSPLLHPLTHWHQPAGSAMGTVKPWLPI